MHTGKPALMFLAAFAAALLAGCAAARAGPPYETDDPEPTDYRNYEIYTALQYERSGDDTSANLPLLEINCGLFAVAYDSPALR